MLLNTLPFTTPVWANKPSQQRIIKKRENRKFDLKTKDFKIHAKLI